MNKGLTVTHHEVAKDIQHWYLIQISFFNWSEAEGSVSHIKEFKSRSVRAFA